ncbi:hypothetical protein LTR17_027148 [Elasticomyces elasticus]|nr:hypothetical protein LTR17_027148 [Elasticomyces elasticus]
MDLEQVEKAPQNDGFLEAELATAAARNVSVGGGIAAGVPTLEAATNTTLKLTAMMERKSGDSDVLEPQIRKLPDGVALIPKLDADYADQLVASLVGSKLLKGSSRTTPTAGAGCWQMEMRRAGMLCWVGTGSARHPEDGHSCSPKASRLGISTSSTPRRKMVDVTEAEVEAYRSKTEQRRVVLGALRKEVESKGPRVVKVEV